MRPIKFRGRDRNGEWWYGSLAQFPDSQTAHIIPCGTCKGDSVTCDFVEVDPSTVGQFTGMLDRDGKEIYEGDIILQRGYYGKSPMEVRYDSGAFITGWHGGSSTARRPMLIQSKCEIIGNIHDNPELLKDFERI